MNYQKSEQAQTKEHNRPPEVNCQLEVLTMNIESLSKAVAVLGGRLSPVMRNEPMPSGGGDDAKSCASPLAEQIHESALRVIAIMQTVERYTQMLEI